MEFGSVIRKPMYFRRTGPAKYSAVPFHPDIRPGGNHTSVRLDINDYPAVEALFDHICPDVVVNCSALSVPDYCEQHREEAYAINVSAVENLAYCCEHQGSRLIHLSTDFVFDGRSDRLYTEEDLPAPLNYYGVTKYQGRTSGSEYLPQLCYCPCGCRLWESVAGQHGNVLQLVKNRLEAGQEIRVVADQYRTDLGRGYCRRRWSSYCIPMIPVFIISVAQISFYYPKWHTL